MSLVGPRPEDPRYVALYSARAAPGAGGAARHHQRGFVLYRNEEQELVGEDWEKHYVEVVMQEKLTIDIASLQHASMLEDLRVLGRTALALFR